MNKLPRARHRVLGVDCGGTRTVAILAANPTAARPLKRREFPGANLRLLADDQLTAHFQQIAAAFPRPDALGVGMAGVRHAADEARIRRILASVWGGIPAACSHDLETALAASAFQPCPAAARVIVLSGTGSCCYGRSDSGRVAKVGGWGHLIGDKGSGYEIGLRALKASVYYLDRDEVWGDLGQSVLEALNLGEPEDLIGWAQNAGKRDIAALAIRVFECALRGDPIASDILDGAAGSLAKDAVTCARRLVSGDQPVQFLFTGSVLLKQEWFASDVARRIQQLRPASVCEPLAREAAWGAVALAFRSLESVPGPAGEIERSPAAPAPAGKPFPLPRSGALPPTEQRNPRSMNLDQLDIEDAVALMLDEESRVPATLKPHISAVAALVRRIVRALRAGGRLFYVGAGTSGRLGALDASECPPTFRTPSEQVQAILAGGPRAMWRAVEGAEDDPFAGASEIRAREVAQNDVVVGIAASGRTPFVWGALKEARDHGAFTALICFNPLLGIPKTLKPNLVISAETGPEVLTGSTRLKAGTATKLLLNILSTVSMVRLGKVKSNLMIDLDPTNSKLRGRAARIVSDLTGAELESARAALADSGWNIHAAVDRLKKKSSNRQRVRPN